MTRTAPWRDRLGRSWWGEILGAHDTEPTELGAALLMVGIGLFLLLPVRTFQDRGIYNALAALPEPVWGALMTLLGLFAFAALRAGHQPCRRWVAMLSFLVWLAFAISFLVGDPINTGAVVYPLICLALAWVWVRLGMQP